MELLAFIALFFMFSVYLMPTIGFSYKICEGIYKRSLFTKSAMQIQAFCAGLLFLSALALGADYFMQGTYYTASLPVMPVFQFMALSHEFVCNPVLYLACATAFLGLLCFIAAKFPKSGFLHFISAVMGLCLVFALAYWVFCISFYSPTTPSLDPVNQIKPTAFTAYCIDFIVQVLGVSGTVFAENPFALLDSAILYSYVICLFVFLYAFLYALYLVAICTLLFRNSMDYGRDYYSFVLNKYGRAIFSFSVIIFLLIIVLLAGFQVSFLNGTSQIISTYLPNHVLYGQIGLALVLGLYFIVSLIMKRNFALAPIPMQKKSLIVVAFVFDFAFGALLYFMIVNAGFASKAILG